jgi:glycogen(starch) synthase
MKTIVFASVLKSVKDVRMYQKLALSLVGNADIHCIGAAINDTNVSQNLSQELLQDGNFDNFISFYPIANFHRLAFQRLLYGFKFLKLLYKIKPNILVINTFELLFFAIFYKYFPSKKNKRNNIVLIYDVMENYFQNISYQNTYSKFIRFPLAFAVRIFENLCSIFIDSFILAEKCYENELEFIGSRYIVLENKLAIPYDYDKYILSKHQQNHENKLVTFIHSGTISQTYGTLEAILFVENFAKFSTNLGVKLILIGFCSDKKYYEILQETCKNLDFIDWQISNDKPVAHNKIMESIATADFALLPYHINKSNKNRIPTKFYEYIYHKVPMIISKNQLWEKFCRQYDAAISCNYTTENFGDENHMATLFNTHFYGKDFDKNEILWTEADRQRCREWILGI